MQEKEKRFALTIVCGGRIRVEPVVNLKSKRRVRQAMPDDFDNPESRKDVDLVELLDDKGSKAAQVILPLLQHIDDKTRSFHKSEVFEDALNTLLTAALKAGARIGTIQKEKELRKKNVHREPAVVTESQRDMRLRMGF